MKTKPNKGIWCYQTERECTREQDKRRLLYQNGKTTQLSTSHYQMRRLGGGSGTKNNKEKFLYRSSSLQNQLYLAQIYLLI